VAAVSASRPPTPEQARRRRAVAAGALGLAVAAIAYLNLTGGDTPLGGGGDGGYRLVHLTVDSEAVGKDLGVNVIVPPGAGRRGQRSLLVFLHGRGGDEGTFNDVVLEGLQSLDGRGPVVAFPAGGDHGYWHDRAGGDWGAYVTDEVIPETVERFGIDPDRLAIGGISMGGFGAFDIALQNPGRFCAAGGHSPALWFDGSETAPGSFDDAADFERHDVVGAVEADPEAFGETKVWIDYGEADDFLPYDEGFVAAMEAGAADFTAHAWPGGHEGSYWAEHWPDYQRFYLNALAHCP
jgi:S-formylglutathione hydrolase FrmB